MAEANITLTTQSPLNTVVSALQADTFSAEAKKSFSIGFLSSLLNAFTAKGTPIEPEDLINGKVSNEEIATISNDVLFKPFNTSDNDQTKIAQAISNPQISDLLVAIVNDTFIGGTPGSDTFQVGTSRNDLLFSRDGNDVLLAVDSAADLPGLGETDLLNAGKKVGTDKFILGDQNKVYYDDGQPSTNGDRDFGEVSDFNANEDIIQLHGNPNDYNLVEFSELGKSEPGTAIFLKQDGQDELIASVPSATGLDLNQKYFQYKNSDSSKNAAKDEIEQVGTSGLDLSFDTAIDDSGNVIQTGFTSSSIGAANAGSLDPWITKYDGEGNQQWTQQFGTVETDDLFGTTTDQSGNVYVSGRTNGNLAQQNAGIGNDVWLAKYDRDGNQQWIKQSGTLSLDNTFSDIEVDNSGNLYQAGYTNGDLARENPNSDSLIPTSDPWVAKYDNDGNQQWIQQFGTSAGDETFGLSIDKNSNVYTTGWTQGDLAGINAGGDSYDAWVAKFDTNGNQQWTKQLGTAENDWSWDVANDNDGNVFATGWTTGDLGGTNAGSYDAWVAKYDTNGNQEWIKQFGTSGDDASYSIDFDNSGNFYLTGYTDRDLGGTNAGGNSFDAWVAKYDNNGNQIWSQQLGSTERENPFEVTVTDDQKVYVTGITEGDLGANNAGSYDSWIAELSSTDGTLIDFNSSEPTTL